MTAPPAAMTTVATDTASSAATGAAGDAVGLLARFPARPLAASWPSTRASRARVDARLAAAPFVADTAVGEDNRRRGVRIVADWLESQPGAGWQQRWEASGVGVDGRVDWRALPIGWRRATTGGGCRSDHAVLGSGLLSLICADVLRPSLAWLLTTVTPKRLASEMARTRDPAGFAALMAACEASPVGEATTRVALHRVVAILAAKGGTVGEITTGDCLELLAVAGQVCDVAHYRSPYFYQLLRATGVFGPDAAANLRALAPNRQLSVEQLVDRCGIACQPVRDLLVDYLRERQIGLDHVTLIRLADALGRLFWADLEAHHPGIDTLRLAPAVATAWKLRVTTKTTQKRQPDGMVLEQTSPRRSATNVLGAVRAFYLDLAHWATDDPARWGPWAVPCPVKAEDIPHRKEAARRKSAMDARTRERLPVLPALVAFVDVARAAATARLAAATATNPGELFTVDGQTLRRVATTRAHVSKIWAQDPAGGRRRNLTQEEWHAFWTWAVVELLRHTGLRIEELTEITHASLVQYRLPTTRELIPLLHVVPSKTDTERLLVISPELADVLSAIICRVRDDTGAIPLVASYDYHERVFNPPLPLLFQRRVGTENRPLSAPVIRTLLDEALTASGLTGADGAPLRFVPHDFRRIFVTDAVMNGMPPHIAQLVVGHRDINTTMGYKAIYPEEAINGHHAFLARRRTLRPSEEYRIPTEREWDDFLGHFERRKVAYGTCGRAFGTTCVHEHTCVRCALLRPDPVQRGRLADVADNLRARINEARRHGWLGEVEGLTVSLAGAEQKLAQLDALAARRAPTDLGLPAFPDVVGRTITSPREDRSAGRPS
ncbi:site-specific integrase [Frankia sp. CiP3]|uniref:site-specific integrase n=1 Tax=Frankia sp. CiP3 TaxID=2880971 RepID=UPI001EF4DB0E|nr:site-specific integrase [Frankia sp. CiP3]